MQITEIKDKTHNYKT